MPKLALSVARVRKSGMKIKVRVIAAILAASFLGAGHARAMEILYFARMALDDQSTYVSDLVIGSAKMLRATGHPDQAQKAIALFKDSTSHGGVSQLASNLKHLQQRNTITQSVTNGRQTHYDVEAAMQLTLRNNGIDVPLKFMETINRNFSPSLPMRPHV
jgi:hypothetical protein